jgi:TIR domain
VFTDQQISSAEDIDFGDHIPALHSHIGAIMRLDLTEDEIGIGKKGHPSMKIFIGWSGAKSKLLAKALYDWLPNVLQNVEPYMSEEIEKGTSWASEIGNEVQNSDFGLCCITRDNLTAPWLHFEAGALSKVVDKSYVVPILFDIVQ